MNDELRRHWERAWSEKADHERSWTQTDCLVSRDMFERARRTAQWTSPSIVDIGGGSSAFSDWALSQGYDVTALDLSAAALEKAKKENPTLVTVEADVREWTPNRRYSFWHDRAAFHFLTDKGSVDRYLAVMNHATAPGSYAVIATFGESGPEKCSGLPVRRYSNDALAAVFCSTSSGRDWHLVEGASETHMTPWGSTQAFEYVLVRRD